MEQLLEKVLERNDVAGARMVAGAVRSRYQSDPDRVILELGAWTEHKDPLVRIAAGASLGALSVRNREALPAVMPFIERLANDQDPKVRRLGAAGGLETVWLYHYDEIWLLVEDWIERKNDLVRRVAVEAMGAIVRGNKINRPSMLKTFIERSMAIIDRLAHTAPPVVRPALASTVNDFGSIAPDLISPWVRTWASRSELNTTALAKEVLELPFGDNCKEIDKEKLLNRVADIERDLLRKVCGWLRKGRGRMEYLTIIVDRILAPAHGDDLPADHWADPYRGCQYRCEFCGTRSLSEYGGEKEDDFTRRLVVVRNAPEALARELSAGSWRSRANRNVILGMNADPYQPVDEEFRITRDMLKVFLEQRNPVIVQTRSEKILRDLDLLASLAKHGLVNVLLSLPSPIEGIRKKVEVGVSSVAERLRTISMLSKQGIPVGLVISPIIPHLTDHPDGLEDLVRRAGDAGADFVIPEVLNLRGTAGPKVRYFLGTYIPALLPKIEALYADSPDGKTADPEYVRGLLVDLIPSLAGKHEVNRTDRMLVGDQAPEAYLARGL
jgi:DNA repair photolyase